MQGQNQVLNAYHANQNGRNLKSARHVKTHSQNDNFSLSNLKLNHLSKKEKTTKEKELFDTSKGNHPIKLKT